MKFFHYLDEKNLSGTRVLSVMTEDEHKRLKGLDSRPGFLAIPCSLQMHLNVAVVGDMLVASMWVDVNDQIGPRWCLDDSDDVLPIATAAIIESFRDRWDYIDHSVTKEGESRHCEGCYLPLYRVVATFRRKMEAS